MTVNLQERTAAPDFGVKKTQKRKGNKKVRTKITGAAAHLHTVAWMKQNPSMTPAAIRQRNRRAAKRASKMLVTHK
jgi:hypothetical protein